MRAYVMGLSVVASLVACKGGSAHGGDAEPDRYAPQTSPTSSTPVNATPLPPERVLEYVNRDHLPAYEGPTGSIQGTVVVTGDPSPETKNRDYSKCPRGAEAYRKLFREGPARADGARPVADALVAVTGYAGGYLPEQRPARVVAIDDCVLSSRTIDMTIGQRLDFKNLMKDKIFAPAFIQTPSVLGLVAPPAGDPVSLYPQAPGALTLFDRFGAGSAYLSAEVYVLVQPLHAVSDLEGHYRIDGIPLGDVKVNARLGVINQQTTLPAKIRANAVETLDLTLTYKASAVPLFTSSPVVDGGRPRTILK